MRLTYLGVTLLFLLTLPLRVEARSHLHSTPHDAAAALSSTLFKVSGLQFNLPANWVNQPADTPARAGQWRVRPTPAHDSQNKAPGDPGQVVCLYFGRGRGGEVKDNIDAWIATMFNAEGQAAAAEVKRHQIAGLKISQVVVFGTYSQPVPLPGMPPVAKPNYGLIGTVIESPQGNIYWRFTGPEPLITANLPLFGKMIDSVKSTGK